MVIFVMLMFQRIREYLSVKDNDRNRVCVLTNSLLNVYLNASSFCKLVAKASLSANIKYIN